MKSTRVFRGFKQCIVGSVTAAAALVAVSGGGLVATAQTCPEEVGVWPYGPTVAVGVTGSRAVIGSGTALVVTDVSNPAEPVTLGEVVLPGAVRGVAVVGNRVYVANRKAGLRIVDIVDPTNPVEIGAVATDGYARAVTVSGGYAYIAASGAGLVIVDVSDPVRPLVVGRLSIPATASGVAYSGGQVLLTDLQGTLRVIDVRDPTAPRQVGAYIGFESLYGVVNLGRFAWVAAGRTGLLVLDVADPRQIVEVGSHQTAGLSLGVAVSGTTACVADHSGGLVVFDVSDPVNPEQVAAVPMSGLATRVTIAGDHAYVASSTAMHVVSLRQPGLNVLGRLETPGFAQGVAVTGFTAVVADGSDGMRVIDVVDPSFPREVGADITGPAFGVEFGSGYALVAAGSAGLRVVDIADPAQPAELATLDTPGFAAALAVDDSWVYVADSEMGVSLVDLSNPAQPRHASVLDTMGSAQAVAVKDGLVFIADGLAGLLIADMLDPDGPRVIGAIDTPGRAVGVAAAGNYAWVADSESGLRAFDVSDPERPVGVGALVTSGPALAVALTGNFVAVAWGQRGLGLVDVHDPAHLREVELFHDSGTANSVTFADHKLFLAQGTAGMRIIGLGDPVGSPTLVGSWSGTDNTLDVHMSEDLLFVANETSGLRVLGVSNPAQPTSLGLVSIPGSARRVEVTGDLAWVAAGADGLFVVDASTPADPVVIGSWATPSGAVNGFTIAGEFAFVAGTQYFRVLDVSVAASPTEIGRAPVGSETWDVAVAGSFAYVANGSAGVLVFDVSEPTAPTEIGFWDSPGFATRVAVSDDLVFVADGDEGLRILDVSSPGEPTEVGSYMTAFPARAVVVSGALAFVADGGFGVTMVDVSDPTSPVAVGMAETPGSATGLAASGHHLWVANESSGVTAFDAAACNGGLAPLILITQPAAGATIRNLSPVEVDVEDFVLDCDGMGGAAEEGFGHWQLWVDEEFDSEWCTTEGRLTGRYGEGEHVIRVVLVTGDGIALDPSVEDWTRVVVQDLGYVIPAAARTAGFGGANWVTDVVLHNPGHESASVEIELLGRWNGQVEPATIAVDVPAGESVKLANIIEDGFGLTGVAGALEVRSTSPLVVTSRTYTDGDGGTYGQFIPAVPRSRMLTELDVALLPQLTGSLDFHTNIGFVNLGTADIDVVADLYSADGTRIGALELTIDSRSFYQVNHVFSGKLVGGNTPRKLLVEDGYALVSTASENATYLTYASVVDKGTGDPVYVAPAEVLFDRGYVAAVAHGEGLAGTDWRSDLEVCSADGGGATFALELLPAGTDNSDPDRVVFNLSPGVCARYRDVVAGVFGATGAGAVRLALTNGHVAASSRTFTGPDGLTFGQGIPASAADGAAGEGEEVRLVQLAYSADRASGFRTNLGVVSASEQPIVVEAALFSGDGELLGSLNFNVPPFSYVQKTDVWRSMTAGSVDDGFAVLISHTPGARYFPWASVVDNVSGDPVFISAVPTQ